ncbi:MAG: hypothetical protein ACK5HL_00720 [Bacilli bacterium]
MLGGYPVVSLDEIKSKSKLTTKTSKNYYKNEANDIIINESIVIMQLSNDIAVVALKIADYYTFDIANKISSYYQKKLWLMTQQKELNY